MSGVGVGITIGIDHNKRIKIDSLIVRDLSMPFRNLQLTPHQLRRGPGA